MKKPFKIQGLLLITMGIIVILTSIKVFSSEKLNKESYNTPNINDLKKKPDITY